MLKQIAAAALVAVMGTGTAQAAAYSLSYTSGGTSFAGTLTTSDTADANGYYLITGLSATRNGSTATLLAPGTFPSQGPNDNLFKPTAGYFDDAGFSYAAGGTNYNLGFDTSYFECFGTTARSSGCRGVTGLTVTPVAAGVPEPATWAMLTLGFGAIGGMLRRRAVPRPRTAGAR